MLYSFSTLCGLAAIVFMGITIILPFENSYNKYKKDLQNKGFSPFEIEQLILRKKEIATIKTIQKEIKYNRIYK